MRTATDWLTLEELRGMPSPELRTGIFAEAVVVVDPQAESIVIPRSALMEFAGTEKVWKVVDGMAREQIGADVAARATRWWRSRRVWPRGM